MPSTILPRWVRDSSPSFLLVTVLCGTLLLGYGAWRVWRPNPVKRSDRIVRAFAADARRVVGKYRRSIAVLLEKVRTQGSAPETADELRSRTARAIESVQTLADAAEAELDEMEGISLRTLRNRLRRIRKRLEEARSMIREEEARAMPVLLGKGGLPPKG